MKVIAAIDNTNQLPLELHHQAYGQDESGVVRDIIIGNEYTVYGYAELNGWPHYLVEKSYFTGWLWWMSAGFYLQSPDDIKKKLPKKWQVSTYNLELEPNEVDSTMIAPKILLDNMAELVDNSLKAQQIVKQVKDQIIH